MGTVVENKDTQENPVSKSKKEIKPGITICLILLVLFVSATALLSQSIISRGAEAVSDSYKAAYMSEKDVTYQSLYKKYYDKAEAENHVKNRASIFVGSINEMAKLEVLKVSDVEFIVEDKDSNTGNITSWLEVPGEAVFYVDLSMAEFVVDNERAHVLVRIPFPELQQPIHIDYSNVEKILFKDDIFNGSYKQGEDLAKKQLEEADLLIKKEFASNQHFYSSAQEAAKSSIKCLIRQLNPSIEGLIVDVEYY